ncbi:MSCRAMM family protein [Companilactobacillus versmoldensis]|uniref:Cell surface protein n=1 Tax=Companilactobacillus versmoldensis DSM 14857 = KCTC 3814 TaxID=1423815 RepID=A0A0R1SB92_9LACO|nr:SpaA isopeptide-forming pilin-related protein [Companilactobacillus versmoldensis]KRL66343.1 cell surface protein precursor [Companilactobacillus versmoldensis DSM 14857 = KCTC 3814]
MKKRILILIFSLATIMMALFSFGSFCSYSVKAAEIPITGNTGADAVMVDNNGNSATADDQLMQWQRVKVSYDWSIPDNQAINAGDTAAFTLPNNVVAKDNLKIPVYDSTGKISIGTFTTKKGDSTGTLTFDHAMSITDINRKGKLSFYAVGTKETTENPNDFVINKNGWIPNQKALAAGLPDKITWNIAFNSTGADWEHVDVIDTLGPGQKYVPGSIHAYTGYYLDGKFITTGEVEPIVTVDGNNVTFHFMKVNTVVNMVYDSILTDVNAEGQNTWVNNVTIKGKDIEASTSHKVHWGGTATGGGKIETGDVILNKTSTADGSAVPGASFKLLDAVGNVVQENLVTDNNGQIVVKGLDPGDYAFVETGCPVGFQPNSNTEYPFTISPGQTAPIQVSAVDTPDEPAPEPVDDGDLAFFKVDSDTKSPLSGAVYNLLDDQGNVITSGLTTDESGLLALTGLSAGNYQLVETKAPEGYDLDATPIKFKIDSGKMTTLYAQDKKTVATVTPPDNKTNVKPPDNNNSVTPPDDDDNETPSQTPGGGQETPGGNGSNTTNPGTETPSGNQPGTSNPGTEAPSGNQPGTSNPGTETPSGNQPGTTNPETETPATNEPGETESNETTPSGNTSESNSPLPNENSSSESEILNPEYPASQIPESAWEQSIKAPTTNSKKPGSGLFPQTSNQAEGLLAIIGGIILALLIGLRLYHHKIKKS